MYRLKIFNVNYDIYHIKTLLYGGMNDRDILPEGDKMLLNPRLAEGSTRSN